MTTDKAPALPLRCQEEKCAWFRGRNEPDCACPDVPQARSLTFATSPVQAIPCPHFKAVSAP